MLELALAIGVALGIIVGIPIGVAAGKAYHHRRLEQALREVREALK